VWDGRGVVHTVKVRGRSYVYLRVPTVGRLPKREVERLYDLECLWSRTVGSIAALSQRITAAPCWAAALGRVRRVRRSMKHLRWHIAPALEEPEGALHLPETADGRHSHQGARGALTYGFSEPRAAAQHGTVCPTVCRTAPTGGGLHHMNAPLKARGTRPQPTIKGTTRITWFCTACKEPITAGTGYLEVDTRAVHSAEEAARKFNDKYPEGFDVVALDEYPDPVPWLPWHEQCDPDPEHTGYYMEIHRIDSLAKLVHWAGHLGGKTWINKTDWNHMMTELGQDA
jgi:hypothetical protein